MGHDLLLYSLKHPTCQCTAGRALESTVPANVVDLVSISAVCLAHCAPVAVSVLFHVKPELVRELYITVGVDYHSVSD